MGAFEDKYEDGARVGVARVNKGKVLIGFLNFSKIPLTTSHIFM